jgi:glycerate kinase
VEAAQANGLFYLWPDELSPLEASTHGVGELLIAAAVEGAARIVVGVGGSATTDGGAGMAQSLGAVLTFTPTGASMRGGGSLSSLQAIRWQLPELLAEIPIQVATDVTNPLLGREGAAAVFAPQKGATKMEVELLEWGLRRYAAIVERDLGTDVRILPGGGASGGLAAGMVAFLKAEIRSGFDVVAEATGFYRRLEAADLVITGEGSFDGQSLRGKTTGRVVQAAEAAGVPWLVLAGVVDHESDRVRSLRSFASEGQDSMAEAPTLLERLTATAMGSIA